MKIIEKLDGWGKLSYENLLDSCERSKKIDFDKFLYALGIRYVGETISPTANSSSLLTSNKLGVILFEYSFLDIVDELLIKSSGISERNDDGIVNIDDAPYLFLVFAYVITSFSIALVIPT